MIVLTLIQWLFLAYVAREILKKNGYEFQQMNNLSETLINEGNKLACNVAYVIIREYSKFQIYLQKWLKKNNITMNVNAKQNMPHEICIDFCKDNKVVKTIVVDKDLIEHIQLDISSDKYDFVILTDDLHKINHSISNKILLKSSSSKTLNVDKSNLKFLSFNVHYKDNVYEIKLQNDNENFYTINNRIDKDFLKFQLKKMGVDVDDDFSYKIELVDHNVNIIELDDKDEIIIRKDDYEIVKKIASKVETEIETEREIEREIEGYVDVDVDDVQDKDNDSKKLFAVNYII